MRALKDIIMSPCILCKVPILSFTMQNKLIAHRVKFISNTSVNYLESAFLSQRKGISVLVVLVRETSSWETENLVEGTCPCGKVGVNYRNINVCEMCMKFEYATMLLPLSFRTVRMEHDVSRFDSWNTGSAAVERRQSLVR